MKKRIIAGMCILLLLVLLTPLPFHLKDGGTVVYRAVLYSVEDVRRMNPDDSPERLYLEGTVVKILGIEVYNNVK